MYKFFSTPVFLKSLIFYAGIFQKDAYMSKTKLKEHLINREWCKGCGICVHFCPKNVLGLDEQEKVFAARPEDCICCRMCEIRCPDLAIEIITQGEQEVSAS